jgi:putative FmdB family regulatory protein
MPIFEYECESCHGRFEELTLSSRAADPSCPACSSDHVHKVYSTFAAQSKAGSNGCEGGFCETPSAGMCGGPCGGGMGPCSVN